MAYEFQEEHFKPYKHLSHAERTVELETQYWKYVEDNIGEKIEVQYAADLPAKEFGSGFSTDPNNEYSKHPWNFNNMDLLNNSMLQI